MMLLYFIIQFALCGIMVHRLCGYMFIVYTTHLTKHEYTHVCTSQLVNSTISGTFIVHIQIY